MLKEGNMYIPKDEKLRVEIIQLHHSISITGHGEKVEDNRVGNEKLLVVRGNKGCGKIYGRM